MHKKATSLKGDSAGHLPNHVRREKFPTKDQKTRRETGEKFIPLKRSLDLETVKRNRYKTEHKRATTPPSLLGIERRIA